MTKEPLGFSIKDKEAHNGMTVKLNKHNAQNQAALIKSLPMNYGYGFYNCLGKIWSLEWLEETHLIIIFPFSLTFDDFVN